MSRDERWSDETVDRMVGNLLRAGVVLAAIVVLAGGVIFLVRHGSEVADFRTFQGEPEDLRTLSGVIRSSLALRGRGIIQLGLLLLIATPVARVVFLWYAFLRQRDYLYVAVTLVVLGALLFSLFGMDV